MKQVSKEYFYEFIGPLDVVLTTIDKYPYRTEFKLRSGGLVGIHDSDGRCYLASQEN